MWAIKLGDRSYYYDGTGDKTDLYKPMGWYTLDRVPTGYHDKADAERIVAFWYDNNGDPKTLEKWHSTQQGHAVGKFINVIDPATKKSSLKLNPGPFPEVVEVEPVLVTASWGDRVKYLCAVAKLDNQP